MKITNHKLDGIPFMSLVTKDITINPKLIILHFTGGSTVDGSINSMRSQGYSSHLIVDRDGKITQLVPFNKRANHAGKSIWKNARDCNSYSIGIEIANWGALHKTANDKFASWVGKEVDVSNVIFASHKLMNPDGSHGLIPWEKYYEPQILAVKELILCIGKEYPSIREVVGHEDVSPYRKSDPGPAAPMVQWQNALRGNAVNDEETDYWVVNSSAGLNVRSGPGTNFDRIDRLSNGTKVTISTGKKEWRYISYLNNNKMSSGWVHNIYLTDI